MLVYGQVNRERRVSFRLQLSSTNNLRTRVWVPVRHEGSQHVFLNTQARRIVRQSLHDIRSSICASAVGLCVPAGHCDN